MTGLLCLSLAEPDILTLILANCHPSCLNLQTQQKF